MATDELNTSIDIKELSNNKNNIEDSDILSNDSKDNIKKKQDKEKKDIDKSKPKLILKIPIPYTDKFIILKLSLSLGLKIGSALLLALALKLYSNMTSKIPSGFPIQPQDFDINDDDIKNELNNINIDDINISNKNGDDYSIDDSEDDIITSKITSKKKQGAYSYLNRGRTDLLDSDNVKNRTPQNKGNKNNPNYGNYF